MRDEEQRHGPRALRYESRGRVRGLPLVSVAFGPSVTAAERHGHACGVIALGDRATGLLALGAHASGVFALGGHAEGLFALGGRVRKLGRYWVFVYYKAPHLSS